MVAHQTALPLRLRMRWSMLSLEVELDPTNIDSGAEYEDDPLDVD